MGESQKSVQELIAEQVKKQNEEQIEKVEKVIKNSVSRLFEIEENKRKLDAEAVLIKEGLKKLELPKTFAFSL